MENTTDNERNQAGHCHENPGHTMRSRPASAPSPRLRHSDTTSRTSRKYAGDGVPNEGGFMSPEEIRSIALAAGMSKLTLMDLYR
eukprot:5723716-Pyramimonas_sp.AAC.1